MSQETAERLTRAKALIDAPEKLVKGETAKDANGVATVLDAPDAVCFCVGGAMYRVAGGGVDFEQMGCALAKHLPAPGNVFEFNDAPTTKHADMMAVFDAAIAAEMNDE